MGALGQPLEHPLCTDHRQRIGARRAVDCGCQQQPTRTHQLCAGLHVERHIVDMLDHFHAEHDVECLTRRCDVLGRRHAIVDRQRGLLSVQARNRHIPFRRIDADDMRPQSSQRLGQQATAAADIEDAQTIQRADIAAIEPELPDSVVADIGKPNRVDAVQRLELARRVPPGFRHRGELGDFVGVDRRGRHVDAHASLSTPAVAEARRALPRIGLSGCSCPQIRPFRMAPKLQLYIGA